MFSGFNEAYSVKEGAINLDNPPGVALEDWYTDDPEAGTTLCSDC